MKNDDDHHHVIKIVFALKCWPRRIVEYEYATHFVC